MADVVSGIGFEPRSSDTWRDPFPMYRGLRDHDPVHHVDRGDYWVLSRYDDVFRAVRDTATYSSAQGLTFTYDERATAGLDEIAPMVFLDPPDHTEFRRLVAAGFTPRNVTHLEPAVRAFVRDRLDRVVADGGGDIVDALLKPLPSFVVAHYLGVPEQDRDRFDAWTHDIVAGNALGDPLLAGRSVGDLFEYFTGLILRRRHDPGDDVISELVAVSDRAGVSALRILGFAFTMVTGGNDTTTGLTSVGLDLLEAEPDQRAELAADPAAVGPAVEELLRLTSPVQGLARTVTTDVTIHGTTIPAGRKVLLLYASANRDERRWGTDAGSLDVHRAPTQILTFGYGAHHCLGAAAARLMGRVVFEEVLRSCPRYELDRDAARFAPGHFVRWYESLPLRVGS